ncbi:MAG: nucleotidyltransferase domain-containing protein [Nitrospirae bacterium]|nr:nucleotidyltransferase domain-containing protein [Nitrospirota bacterium]
MGKTEAVETLKKHVLEFFAGDDVKIVLFGSFARSANTRASDIDIGILPGIGFDKIKLTLLRERIENLNIPHKVDLVDLSRVSGEFRSEALKDSLLWKDGIGKPGELGKVGNIGKI